MHSLLLGPLVCLLVVIMNKKVQYHGSSLIYLMNLSVLIICLCSEELKELPCLNPLSAMLGHRGKELTGDEDVQLAPECLIIEVYIIEKQEVEEGKNMMGL